MLQQIRQLQKAAEGHQQEVAVMHDCMTQIMTELTTLGRVADAAAASVPYGTEQKESVAKMSNLYDRVQVLQQVIPDCTQCFQPPQGVDKKQQEYKQLMSLGPNSGGHWLTAVSTACSKTWYDLVQCVPCNTGSHLKQWFQLLQVVQTQAGQVDRLKQRKIPVVWFGIAQEVRLMGSFDNWTHGFSLSAEEFSDGTFTKFQGTLRLVPVS